MSDNRYSIMVLPRRQDGSILLQSWVRDGVKVTDGFGSFHQFNEDPKQVAERVLNEFDIKAQPIEVAKLQYFMDKPTGIVNLKIAIYFAEIEQDPILQEQMHWFASADIPYKQIHPATGKWLPLLLSGKIPLKATVKVYQPGDHIKGKVTEFTIVN